MRITALLAIAATVSAAMAVPATAVATESAPLEAIAPATIADSNASDGASALVGGRAYARVKGANRYETAVAVSKAVYPKGVRPDGTRIKYVYVTSGEKFPDALAVGPLAGGRGSLLLVPKSGPLPKSVKAELARLKRPDVIIFGGATTVSAGMAKQLDSAGGAVIRVNGANRYGTAAQVTTLQDTWLKRQFNRGVQNVYVANGATYADALGASSAGANTRGAVLLTTAKSLPKESATTLRTISPTTVYVLGGNSSVSPAVLEAIKTSAPNAKVMRIAGKDRTATAAALSRTMNPTPSKVRVALEATGNNYPDALAAAPLAWWYRAPMLLTRPGCLSRPTNAEINRLKPSAVVAVGGAVSRDTLHQDKLCSK